MVVDQNSMEGFRLWLAALRSGKYKKATQRLRRGDCFCALGVGVDVYIQNNSDSDARWKGDFLQANGHILVSTPTEQIYRWLTGDLYDEYNDRSIPSVVILNDRWMLPFPQIADTLEAAAVALGYEP